LQPRQRSEYVGYGHGDRRVDMSSEENDRAAPGRLQRIILSTCSNPAGPPEQILTFFSKFWPSIARQERSKYPPCVLRNK
jgi:hypothetical protein